MPIVPPGRTLLKSETDQLCRLSVAPSTHAAYQSGLRKWKKFLFDHNYTWDMDVLPVISSEVIIEFTTYCHAVLSLGYSTIKLYLAGIRFHYISSGQPNPLSSVYTTDRLQMVLRGIKRQQGGGNRTRLPITFDILVQISNQLANKCFSPVLSVMMKAVCTLAFFGFLRSGEFCVVGDKFDPSSNLCVHDLQCEQDSQSMCLCLKSSKTDPFRQGVRIHIFANPRLCPVKAMCDYLKMRKTMLCASPALFIDDEGKPLTRGVFVSNLKQLIFNLGLDSTKYNGHSFRIGAATTAAAAGVEDHLIQTLGRWSSSAYTRYIRTSRDSLCQAQAAMCFTSD